MVELEKTLKVGRGPKFFKGAKLAKFLCVVNLLDLLLLFYRQINSNSAINFIFILSFSCFLHWRFSRESWENGGKSCMLLTQGFRYRLHSSILAMGEQRSFSIYHYIGVFSIIFLSHVQVFGCNTKKAVFLLPKKKLMFGYFTPLIFNFPHIIFNFSPLILNFFSPSNFSRLFFNFPHLFFNFCPSNFIFSSYFQFPPSNFDFPQFVYKL